MIRAPLAFITDGRGRLTAAPAFEWFKQGKGIATRKWLGVPAMIARADGDRSYTCYRGTTVTDPPKGFIQTSEAGQPLAGWVPVRKDDFEFSSAVGRLLASGHPIEPGTYELCGPGIDSGNGEEGVGEPILIPHRKVAYINCPRDLDGAVYFLASQQIPGIIWSYDGMHCQLSRSHVGLAWPIPERE